MTREEVIKKIGKENMEDACRRIFQLFNGKVNAYNLAILDMTWNLPFGEYCPIGTYKFPRTITIYMASLAKCVADMYNDAEDKESADLNELLYTSLGFVMMHELAHADQYTDSLLKYQQFLEQKHEYVDAVEYAVNKYSYDFYLENKDAISKEFGFQFVIGDVNDGIQKPINVQYISRSHFVNFRMHLEHFVSGNCDKEFLNKCHKFISACCDVYVSPEDNIELLINDEDPIVVKKILDNGYIGYLNQNILNQKVDEAIPYKNRVVMDIRAQYNESGDAYQIFFQCEPMCDDTNYQYIEKDDIFVPLESK